MLTSPLLPRGDAATATRSLVVIGLTALLAATSVALVLTAPAIAFPELNLLARPFLVAMPAIAGLVSWRRRPDSRTGPLLILLGWLSAVATLQLTRDGTLAQVGLLADVLMLTIQALLVVSYPSGRLRTDLERVAVAALVAGLAIGLVRTPFAPVVRPIDFLSACADACPPNPLFIGDRFGITVGPAPYHALMVAGYALFVAIPVLLVCRARWRSANRRERAALWPLVLTAYLLFPARILAGVVVLASGGDTETFLPIAGLSFALRLLFPVGFLVAILRAELLANRAVADLVVRLSAGDDRSTWAGTIADVIDDPTVRVAFRPAGDLIDTSGHPMGPVAGPGRVRLAVDDGDRRIAVIEISDTLRDDPELRAAVISATRIAAETAELVDDVRASRSRLVGAADAERERLGRDLHDSAQQRLVALRIHLSLARGRLGPSGDDAGLADLDRDLGEALEEIRSIALGLYPSLLARDGIGPALRSVTRGWQLPVQVVADPVARRPEEVEAAVYFVCLEALQNVVKHAGNATHAVVTLADRDGALELFVGDDGAGFDPDAVAPGAGFNHMRDRMAAIGGGLRIDAAPGQGTRVRGWTTS